MKTIPVTPTSANYRTLSFIEQLSQIAPKGTALGLCDLLSAMASGYFVESGGAVIPAIEAFLQSKVTDDEQRAARSRRAAKALTYGSYNVKETLGIIRETIETEGQWKAVKVNDYRLMAVDFTAYHRASVKKLSSKSYDSEVGHATPAISIGLMGALGEVGGQRIALLREIVEGDIKENNPAKTTGQLYSRVAKQLGPDEIAIFDAGFSFVQLLEADVSRAVIRLDKNCTFGRTIGQIPERKGETGRHPTVPRAEIVRPCARCYGDKIIPATTPDESRKIKYADGKEGTVETWRSVYFLESQMKNVLKEAQKEKLREIPINVTVFTHSDYPHPLIVGTTVLSLTPEEVIKVYGYRWPIEGIPQTGKYILSGGGGRHYVHHLTAMKRLPTLSLILGTVLKYIAATLPPFRTGFWDRASKPTYGRLIKQLKKVTIPLSEQLFKKASSTAHLTKGYEAVRLSRARMA